MSDKTSGVGGSVKSGDTARTEGVTEAQAAVANERVPFRVTVHNEGGPGREPTEMTQVIYAPNEEVAQERITAMLEPGDKVISFGIVPADEASGLA